MLRSINAHRYRRRKMCGRRRKTEKTARHELTLYDPRFFTEHANLTFLPAGAVMFSIVSVNSGSSKSAASTKRRMNECGVIELELGALLSCLCGWGRGLCNEWDINQTNIISEDAFAQVLSVRDRLFSINRKVESRFCEKCSRVDL